LEKQNNTAIFTSNGTTSSTEHRPKLPGKKPPGKKGTTEHRKKNVYFNPARQGKATEFP